MTEASETTETTTTTTEAAKPAGKPPAEPSILDTLHKAWTEAGSKDPSPKQTKVLLDAYKSKLAAAAEAKKVSDAAETQVDEAAKAIVAQHGRHIEIPIDGQPHIPACYGTKVYFKKVAATVRKTLNG